VLPQSPLTSFPVETALARAALGAFVTRPLSVCLPTAAPDVIDATGAASPRDGILGYMVSD
jgi:hypothetical protein